MASGQEDVYSYDLTALVDYGPQQYQTTAPLTIGVGGGRLNTLPLPATPDSGIGVGTNTGPTQTNVTVGVGGTRTLRQQTGRPIHLQVEGISTTDLLWDTRHLYDVPPKGNSQQQELRRVEKNPDALHVKTPRLPPVMWEVQEEAVLAEATVVAAEEEVVAAEEVVVGEVAEEEVAEAEVEAEVMMMAMMVTMMMTRMTKVQLRIGRDPLRADGGDDEFSTIKKWNSNWLKSCKISDRWLRDAASRVS